MDKYVSAELFKAGFKIALEAGLNVRRASAEMRDRVKEIADIFYEAIDAFPAADVEPVVHAHWEWHYERSGEEEEYGWRCSNCHTYAGEFGFDDDIDDEPPTRLKACPNCMAHMDERSDEK